MKPARVAATLALAVALGCAGSGPTGTAAGDVRVAGGGPRHGRAVIAASHCGACHRIPGIRGGYGVVGPPLDGFARRSFIGGRVPNTTANLVRWIRDPAALAPGTAMPSLDLDERDARDVAAFLYELR